jgi:hypothetical protein
MIGKRSIRMGLGALWVAGTSACGPSYDTLEVDRIQGATEASISSSELRVPEGRLVVFSAEPSSRRGRDYDVTDELELVSASPAVARVERGIAVDTWVVMGVARGSTTLEVRIDGELEDRITVDVFAQGVSP